MSRDTARVQRFFLAIALFGTDIALSWVVSLLARRVAKPLSKIQE
jgi:hypothetical protein